MTRNCFQADDGTQIPYQQISFIKPVQEFKASKPGAKDPDRVYYKFRVGVGYETFSSPEYDTRAQAELVHGRTLVQMIREELNVVNG